jgi:hypothetical protein
MKLRSLPLLLLCAGPAAFADTIYRWIDDSGQAHYTDDRKTIPRGVQATLTQGDELGLVWAQNPDAQLPPLPTPPPGKAVPAPAPATPPAATPPPGATAPAPVAPTPAPAAKP